MVTPITDADSSPEKTNRLIAGLTSNTDNGNDASIFVISGVPPTENNKRFNRFHICIIVSLLVTVVILSVAVLLLINKNGPEISEKDFVPTKSENAISIPTSTLETEITHNTHPHGLKIVTRRDWLAQPPIQESNKFKKIPVPYVIVMHTATENCSSRAQCIFDVRYIQTFHVESNNWWDIGYNFLVGGDGNAYEGRGWTAEGAHTYGYNSRSIGIAFIGMFEKFKPRDNQITACKQLIQKGVELGYISPQYKLLAASQLMQSGGKALFEEVKTWPHWSPSP